MSEVKSESTPRAEHDYETTKRLFVGAVALIAVGLAVAGSVHKIAGGVILLVGWIAGVMGLHRMGRAGSTPRG